MHILHLNFNFVEGINQSTLRISNEGITGGLQRKSTLNSKGLKLTGTHFSLEL